MRYSVLGTFIQGRITTVNVEDGAGAFRFSAVFLPSIGWRDQWTSDRLAAGGPDQKSRSGVIPPDMFRSVRFNTYISRTRYIHTMGFATAEGPIHRLVGSIPLLRPAWLMLCCAVCCCCRCCCSLRLAFLKPTYAASASLNMLPILRKLESAVGSRY